MILQTKPSRFLWMLLLIIYLYGLPVVAHYYYSNVEGYDIVSDLRSRLSSGAEIYSSDSPSWLEQSSRWSVYKQPTWKYVVVPQDEDDIATTIKFATAHNITFLAQGGSHGFSTTLNAVQNAIMIRLDKFDYAIVDERSQTVKVGGGTTFGTLITALHAARQVLPVGVSPCVGVTGATLGGGHGRLQGLFGLMIDAVRSHRVILGDGRIVTASANSYPDLLYALRGAGQNFGVVTETTFKSFDDPAPNGLYYSADMTFSGEQLEAVLTVVNNIIPNQPGELALILTISQADPSPRIGVNLVWAGPHPVGLEYSRLLNDLSPTTFHESMISFADLPAKSAGGVFTSACTKGAHPNNYSVNMKYFNLTTMRTSYNAYIEFMATNPGTDRSAWLLEIFGQAGVNAFPASSTAYSNRGFGNILSVIQGVFQLGDRKAEAASEKYLSSVQKLLAETSGYGKLHIYQNYAHGGREDLRSIHGYDEKRFLTLQCLKMKYDPGNVFDGYNPIPLPPRGKCGNG